MEFKPQVYVDIRETIDKKVKAMSMHKTNEEAKFASDAIRCLARHRAYQMMQMGGEAETFQVVKMRLNLF